MFQDILHWDGFKKNLDNAESRNLNHESIITEITISTAKQILRRSIYRVFRIRFNAKLFKTSRDRPKSAPYPRLKNSKNTSKCRVFVYSSRKSKIFRNFFLKKLHTKKMDRVARRGSLPQAPGALTSHNAEKLKGGPFEVFQHPFCRKT